MMFNSVDTTLDTEWVKLMKEAKSIGLSAEEVRTYLRERNSAEDVCEVNRVIGD